MKVVLFVHSLASCWNHGNAHFLRGIARDLTRRGHDVLAIEPADGWSRANLAADHGSAALETWRRVYPELRTRTCAVTPALLDEVLDGAGLVLVHEWNAPSLVAELGRRRRLGGRFTLLFHDTHHRMVSDPAAIGHFDLGGYDGVLAFGAALRERYLRHGWGRRVWVWHEAADTSVFRPPTPGTAPCADLVWIGNWGDDERAQELRTFLIEPVRELGLEATVHGVRYPDEALVALRAAGIVYRGWLPNHNVPARFAGARLTVHIPRRPYVEALPGIPTIRVFEALACGIPLVCAPWEDSEGLFPDGSFGRAADGPTMTAALRQLLSDRELADHRVATGLSAIRARHTCAHRVDELLAICRAIAGETAESREAAA